MSSTIACINCIMVAERTSAVGVLPPATATAATPGYATANTNSLLRLWLASHYR